MKTKEILKAFKMGKTIYCIPEAKPSLDKLIQEYIRENNAWDEVVASNFKSKIIIVNPIYIEL